MAKRIQEQKEEEGVCVQVATSSDEYFFLSFVVKFLCRFKFDCIKSPVMPIASEKPDSKMSVEPSSFEAASASQVRLKDAYLGGLKEGQRGDLPCERQENSEETDDSESEPW